MKRIEEFRQLALELHWEFIFSGPVFPTLHVLHPFRLINEAAQGRWVAGIQSSNPNEGVHKFLLELEYTQGNIPCSNTAFFIHSDNMRLQPFYTRPRQLFDRINRYFSSRFLQKSDYVLFDENYSVLAKDRSKANVHFTYQVKAFFSYQTDWILEGQGHGLLMYQKEESIKLQKLKAFVQVCNTIEALFHDKKVIY